MRILAELLGSVVLLLIFAYGVLQIVEAFRDSRDNQKIAEEEFKKKFGKFDK
jgi:hypothetical protein